jgi:hypothetical protein
MSAYAGDSPQYREIASRGAQCCLIASLLQLPVGFYFTSVLRTTEQARLLGGDFLATLTFIAAIVAAIGLLHLLTGVAIFQIDRRKLWHAMLALIVTVTLMTTSMLLSRDGFPPITT